MPPEKKDWAALITAAQEVRQEALKEQIRANQAHAAASAALTRIEDDFNYANNCPCGGHRNVCGCPCHIVKQVHSDLMKGLKTTPPKAPGPEKIRAMSVPSDDDVPF